MLYIKHAKYLRDYQIQLKFSDGTELEVDLQNHLKGEIFEPLKNVSKFKQFRLHPELETIVWENGADLAPEFLYELGNSQLKKRA